MKFLFALTSLLFGYAASEDTGSAANGTVVDVALSDPDTFSSLVDFVVLADLADALATTEGITVFAPINDAFAALTEAAPDVVANLQTEQWQSHLQDVLLYHVLADEVPSSAVTDGLTVTTLNGEDITFTVNDDGIFVNSNSQVVAADVDASNGVIHAIDGVLLPSWVSNTIIDIAQNTEDLSNLVSLILFANPAIVEVLDSPGGYTVFAPSNLSWQALFDQFDVNAATLALLDQQEGILTTALKYHVVDGVYGTGDIVDGLEVTTLQGETLTLSLSNDTASGFTVNGLEILSSDILANNGVVHVIEGVLIPQELTDTDESEVIVPDSVSNATESEPSESSEEPVVEEPTNTVVDVALSDPDTFSSLVDFVVLADLADALATTEGITVFAPINDAFAALTEAAPDVVANLQTEQWQSHLQDVLLYHVLADEVPSSAVTDGLTVTTLNGEDITFTVNDDGIFVNSNSQVVAADVDASNGVIHAIDGVLLPSWVSNTIIDIAQNTEDLSNLVSLILFANPAIVEVLDSPGGYTVFAPSNLSWQALFDQFDVNAATLALLDQQEGILTTALKYHVVDGVYGTGDIVDGLEVTTLQGETLTLSLSNDTASGFTVNGLEILSSDILANNGVVHVIEGVLIPQELTDTDESEVIVPDSVSNATDPESSEEPDAEDTSTNTIVDVAVSTDDLSNLVSLVVEADPSILEALSSPGNYTVFAPNNAAIQALFDEFGVDAVALGALDASTGILSKVLTYHVVEGVYDSSDIVDGIELTTLQGEDLTLNLSGDSATGFVVNDVEIIATDILADNGIVHVINGVLVPKELAAEEEASTEISDTDTESATIVEIASGAADFSTLVSLILLADESIASLLSSPGNFTVLAPTNEAFEQLLSTIDIDVDDLVTLEEKAGFLSKVLSYHVVDGFYESSEIVDGLELITLQGEKITFTLTDDSPTGVAVNGANVVAADILASNGVIHAIDGVLIAPPISGGPGFSVATNDTETDLTSALQAFYGNGLPLILGSLLASISDVSN